MRLEVRKIETIAKGQEDAVGNRVRVKVVKNKVAPPFRRVELEIMFGKGISVSGSLLDGALAHELIAKSGSWYSLGDKRIGQGRENAKQFLEDNPETAAGIEAELRAKLFPALRDEDQGDAKNKKENTEEKEAAKKPRAKNAPGEGGGGEKGGARMKGAADDEDLFTVR